MKNEKTAPIEPLLIACVASSAARLVQIESLVEVLIRGEKVRSKLSRSRRPSSFDRGRLSGGLNQR